MTNNKIILSPPAVFKESSTYLNYISKLLQGTSIPVDIIQSLPLFLKDPSPKAIVGEGIANPQALIHKKMLNAHEVHLEEISNYLSANGVNTNFTYNIQDEQLSSKDLSENLLWIIEVTSDYNLWNELFGTVETILAKDVNIPCLCIPEDYSYEDPDTLLIINNESEDLTGWLPTEIINAFNLKTIIAFEETEFDKEKVIASLRKGDLNTIPEIITTNALNEEASLSNVISKTNPSWIAYKNFDKPLIERIFNSNTNQFILSSQRPIIIL